MEALQQEIVRLLAEGPLTTGDIKNRLNSQPAGWDVSLDDVDKELRRLEAMLIVQRLWRINQDEIQTPIPGRPVPRDDSH